MAKLWSPKAGGGRTVTCGSLKVPDPNSAFSSETVVVISQSLPSLLKSTSDAASGADEATPKNSRRFGSDDLFVLKDASAQPRPVGADAVAAQVPNAAFA